MSIDLQQTLLAAVAVPRVVAEPLDCAGLGLGLDGELGPGLYGVEPTGCGAITETALGKRLATDIGGSSSGRPPTQGPSMRPRGPAFRLRTAAS